MVEKFNQISRFLKYFFYARHSNGHGIHSPFVYDFALKVIFGKDSEKKYSGIYRYIKHLKRCNFIIEFTDLGAGKNLIRQKHCKISTIAINSSTKKKYGKLLARTIEYFKPVNVIELGTSLGIGTSYLTLNLLPESKLFTIEGCENLFSFSLKNCESLHMSNVFPKCGNFDDILPDLLSNIESADLVYIDGNHRKEATIQYFEWVLSKINNNTILIFDDIYWSEGMQEAWNYIKSHPIVKVSIDLFQVGIAFFRKELSKEDYMIRF